MTNYTLEEKDSFTVLGFGTELKSDYRDFASLNKEKADFWETVSEDGTLDTLKNIAMNDYVFAVNEAVNNRIMFYAGVMTEESLPEASRLIQFPKGEYLVVKGEGKTTSELNDKLTGLAFGQVLPEVSEVAYVGGPNATVVIGKRDDLLVGEMWIPVVRK
ncbi:GyrI-like domain-containing protein [Radiobacillus deserti]|uniref:AraC family transcriptional regulator n=1 Tax=Radiobacillus deserti TaxID=2594883 RepID=A0A516KKQ1_9BACI|nr:GyrI-like domain-containing protein [Radiobacillus deserti]QDP41958.1 AraC family transcriptional regulator [Radiobacillus deserti]